jgi:hypothetical protein
MRRRAPTVLEVGIVLVAASAAALLAILYVVHLVLDAVGTTLILLMGLS